jgi:hypothetical protein
MQSFHSTGRGTGNFFFLAMLIGGLSNWTSVSFVIWPQGLV